MENENKIIMDFYMYVDNLLGKVDKGFVPDEDTKTNLYDIQSMVNDIIGILDAH